MATRTKNTERTLCRKIVLLSGCVRDPSARVRARIEAGFLKILPVKRGGERGVVFCFFFYRPKRIRGLFNVIDSLRESCFFFSSRVYIITNIVSIRDAPSAGDRNTR